MFEPKTLEWHDWDNVPIRSSLVLNWTVVLSALAGLTLLWSLQNWLSVKHEAAVPFMVVLPDRLKPGYQWPQQESSKTFEEVQNGKIYPRCPADGRSLSDDAIIPATKEDIDSAIAAAADAQKLWAKTSFAQRRQVLRTLLQYVIDHQEDIVAACCLDSGKTKIDACFGEILVTVEKLQNTIKHGQKALKPSARPTNLLMCYKQNTVVYEPLGVVAACVSWNYPFHNLISPVISALFVGNAVVVKPSEQTCWSSLYFTRFIKGALEACGHSSELVQTVVCLPDVADHLTSHPELGHIIFIGSREIAHKVAASASKSLTGLTVELGGKDPAIVLDDARTIGNLNDIAAILMRGAFQSAGQNCIGIERVIAVQNIHDKLLNHVKDKIQNLRIGSILLESSHPPDMGSMISSRSFTRLEKLIQSAVRDGAILHCGGKRYNHPKYPNGQYFQPTLLSNVTSDMDIAQNELFAPVFLLMRARSVGEAIQIANSTPYALGASVFGHDSKAVQRCVREVRAGMVAINDFGSYYACSMPFGGVKGSGYGRFGGDEGLRALCNSKSLCQETWWAKLLGISTQIPPPLQYPVQGKRGWRICEGIIETGYSIGYWEQVMGVVKLLGGLMAKEEASPVTKKS